MPLILRFWLLPFALMLAVTSPTRATSSAPTGTVVLLHGLGLRGWAMVRIGQTLRREGYRVVNLTYPSRTRPIDELATRWLPEQLAAHGLIDGAELHFVTHSMGGIILRGWLKTHGTPPNLRRVVMLAPPNQGTPLVDRIQTWRSFRWATGVNGRRLGTGDDSFPCRLGPWTSGAELGVIAGDRPILPWFAWWSTTPCDGKVPVDSTRLDGMQAHLVVHHSHTWIQYRRDVLQQIAAFLREGAFNGQPAVAAATVSGRR